MGIEEDRCDLRDGLLLPDCLRMVRGYSMSRPCLVE